LDLGGTVECRVSYVDLQVDVLVGEREVVIVIAIVIVIVVVSLLRGHLTPTRRGRDARVLADRAWPRGGRRRRHMRSAFVRASEERLVMLRLGATHRTITQWATSDS
jgi:hypothetical protein